MAGQNLLTDTGIKTLTLKGNGFHSDGGNLYLRIRGSGRSWVFRFKMPKLAMWADPDARGKPIEIGLGSYPALGIAAARKKVAPYREALAMGNDPRELHRLTDENLKTFKHYAVEYIAKAESGWRNPKHRQQWRNTLAAELQARFDRVIDFPEQMPDGLARLMDLRQIIPDVLEELRRDLPGEKANAGLQAHFRFES